MILELTEEQRNAIMALLQGVTEPSIKNPNKIEGIRGSITISAPVVCPEMCFRFQEHGTCVHLKKEPAAIPGYTTLYKKMREEKRVAKIKIHKKQEPSSTDWQLIDKDMWNKKLPFTYGVYVWVDENDKLIYYAKAVDLRRRHYTWSATASEDVRWLTTCKIWWIHTGWYMELLEEFKKFDPWMVITYELLKWALDKARPFELPEPPPLG